MKLKRLTTGYYEAEIEGERFTAENMAAVRRHEGVEPVPGYEWLVLHDGGKEWFSTLREARAWLDRLRTETVWRNSKFHRRAVHRFGDRLN